MGFSHCPTTFMHLCEIEAPSSLPGVMVGKCKKNVGKLQMKRAMCVSIEKEIVEWKLRRHLDLEVLCTWKAFRHLSLLLELLSEQHLRVI